MGKDKKNVGAPHWKDRDIREESESSDLKTDFPLSEKDEFKEATIRTKKAQERVKKIKTEHEDNPSSE